MICVINSQPSDSDQEGVHAVNLTEESFDRVDLGVFKPTDRSQILVKQAIASLSGIVQKQSYVVWSIVILLFKNTGSGEQAQ